MRFVPAAGALSPFCRHIRRVPVQPRRYAQGGGAPQERAPRFVTARVRACLPGYPLAHRSSREEGPHSGAALSARMSASSRSLFFPAHPDIGERLKVRGRRIVFNQLPGFRKREAIFAGIGQSLHIADAVIVVIRRKAERLFPQR